MPGVSLGKYTLGDLEYAGDTTLFSETANQLLDALSVFDEEAKKLGLKINWSKTELKHVGDGPVPKIKYLGSVMFRTGDLKPEVDQRKALAASIMQSLRIPL